MRELKGGRFIYAGDDLLSSEFNLWTMVKGKAGE